MTMGPRPRRSETRPGLRLGRGGLDNERPIQERRFDDRDRIGCGGVVLATLDDLGHQGQGSWHGPAIDKTAGTIALNHGPIPEAK